MKLGFFLKISILVFSLIGVLYVMRLLKSSETAQAPSDPNSVVGLLVGGDLRLYNWCPQDLLKIEVFTEDGQILKTLNLKQDFVAVCELMIGGFVLDPAHPPQFKIKLKAYAASGNVVSLEMDPALKVFRVKGMPFSSAGLNKALDRLSAP
ncbi:MAG: hypothetical protein ACXVCP_01475 [Bdellovibrio sp.]